MLGPSHDCLQPSEGPPWPSPISQLPWEADPGALPPAGSTQVGAPWDPAVTACPPFFSVWGGVGRRHSPERAVLELGWGLALV